MTTTSSQKAIAGSGREWTQRVADWITVEIGAGARLFAVEALMGAGKTTTMKSVRTLIPTVALIELDVFLDPRVDKDRAWHDAFDSADALHHIHSLLRNDRAVIVEGAICWPTARACDVNTRFIYLRRMQFPDVWADEADLEEEPNETPVRRSVREHHARTKPWLHADLLLERLVTAHGE